MNRFAPGTLIAAGLSFLALRGLLQTMFDRAGQSTDLTDFLFGVMLGIGAGLTIIGIWRGTRGGALGASCCGRRRRAGRRR